MALRGFGRPRARRYWPKLYSYPASRTYKMPDDQSTRYERVKGILNGASGDAHPSYQGHDRFWNLPHAQFLEVTIYGVRMIAPAAGASLDAPAKSCCHGPAKPCATTGPERGRGAASG